MAQLSDAQLDSSFVGEGVKELWGLEEWGLARNHQARPHLRYLAQLTPTQRQRAMSAQGLAFSQLSLAQQQGLIAHLGKRLHSLEELAGATVRVEYTQPGGFAGASEAQIAPTDLSLAVVYTLIDPKTGKTTEQGVRADASGSALVNW